MKFTAARRIDRRDRTRLYYDATNYSFEVEGEGALGSFRVKGRIADKNVTVTDGDGRRHTVKILVKEVAFWSADFCERSRHEGAKVIEKSPPAIAGGVTPAHYAKDALVVRETGQIAKVMANVRKPGSRAFPPQEMSHA